MRTTTERRKLWTLLATALLLVVAWWFVQPGSSPEEDAGPADDTSQRQEVGEDPAPGATDPDSGLSWILPPDLPDEAHDTIALIEQGGPFPYECCDDTTFRNDEGLLPDHPRGYYREYTVDTPGSPDRGARRIVVGDMGEFYWTDDHYRSFSRIAMDHDGSLS